MSDTGPMEAAYDEHVAPLMTKIIAACQEAGIPMFATFFLDDDDGEGDRGLMCASLLTPTADRDDGSKHVSTARILACYAIIRPSHASSFVAVTGGEP